MTHPPDARLDAALRELADAVVFPPVPELSTSVAARLAAPGDRSRPWRWGRPVLLAAALTLLLAATVAALAWALPGLRILPVASVPAAPTVTLGTGLALGEALAPAEPQPFGLDAVGPADAVYESRDGGVTTLVFASRDDLPDLARDGDGDSGVGLLAQRVEGTLDRSMVMKLVEEVGARVVPVTVNGADGFWVATSAPMGASGPR